MLWLATAHAITVDFPGQYASLQQAVDEVSLLAGDHEILLEQDVLIDQTVTLTPSTASSITVRPAMGTASVGGTADPLLDVDGSIDATLRLSDLTLVGSGNRLAIHRTGTLELQRCTATGFGSPDTDGGLVHVRESAVLRLVECQISGCMGRDGAVSEAEGENSHIDVINSSFTTNDASEDGGVFDLHGTMSIQGSTFAGNTAESAGGAINIEAGPTPIQIDDSVFTDNTASRGGAVFSSGRTLTVESCTFTGNQATALVDQAGGAIMAVGGSGSLLVTGSSFEANHAFRGSAIHGRNGSSLLVDQSLFCENTGANGALSAGSGSLVSIQGSLFWANGAGGIDLLDNITSGGLVQRNTFVANLLSGEGQAASVASAAPSPEFSANLVVDHTDVAVLRFDRVDNVYHHNTDDFIGGTSAGENVGDPGFWDPPACSFESVRVDCDGPAADGTQATAGAGICLADGDGDGFHQLVDCDDADPNVNPAAEDTCNGVDDDCNGAEDDDGAFFTTWYDDADGDGFGAGPATTSCAPLGSTDTPGDCDDARVDAFPGADETCNQLDDDCDDIVDEDPIDGGAWYPDADGDGWGQGTAGQGCPVGPSTPHPGDCDDFAPAVNPSATETCNGIDDDCSGEVDEGFDVRNRYLDADGDGYGDPSITALDCLLPPGWTTVADDCDDDASDVNPAGTEDCIDPADNDCDGLLDDDDPDSARSFWPDNDEDGYGDGTSNPLQGCFPPVGQVADATDCDDDDPSIHPDADEDPSDGIDSDCDGSIESDPIEGLGITCSQGPRRATLPSWLRR